MSSLKKCLALDPATLYPAHGEVIENATPAIEEYIKHRQLREDQIVAYLQSTKGKSQSAMEIVKVLYKDVREDLHFAAEHGVKLHLQKLKQDGLVDESDDTWRMCTNSRI